MAYNNLVSRTDAGPLIPEEVTKEIFQNVPERSAVMQLARRLPNGSRGQERLPVLSALVSAGFITGDTGLVSTTEANWTNKYIYYEGIGAIVPVPKRVLMDLDYDLWGQVRPNIEEAIGKVFDLAVFHGTNAPSAWPTNIVSGASSASHTVALGTGADLYEDVMGEGGTLTLVEQDGYGVTGHVGAMSLKGKLRGTRTTEGQPIFLSSPATGRMAYELDGSPILFPKNGGITASSALLISGDFNQIVWSVRQELDVQILKEAVIQDGSGAIVYNLAQQQMVAMMVTFYAGWALPNPPTRLNETEATRYPFSVLTP